jgi:hypothetical protein
MYTPSVHIGHQLIRVGKVGHFLEQPLKFDAVLGHARCIDLFLKVRAVLLPGDRRRVGPTRLLWTPRLAWRRYGVEVGGVYRNAKSSKQTPSAITTVSITTRTISLLVFMPLSPYRSKIEKTFTKARYPRHTPRLIDTTWSSAPMISCFGMLSTRARSAAGDLERSAASYGRER